jgi:hypothetical protein
MASAWSTWVRWNGSIEQTLVDGHHLAAGEASIAEARKAAQKAGAGGLLEVMTLTDRPFLGRCWVLSQDELHRHFGSKTPHKKAIEAGAESFLRTLDEAQAVALTAFTKGVPTAVLFAGKSGR